MRLKKLLPTLILLAGCERETSFDQRYEETAGAIENQASSIDRDLKNGAMQAEPADAPVGEPSNDHE